jgi:hypothetical protein
MAKINPKEFGGKGAPAITPEDIGGKKAAILTVEKVNAFTVGQERRMSLHVEEFADKVLYLNVTSIKRLIEQYGDDDEGWVSQAIVVMPVTAEDPNTGQPTQKLWIADADTWASVMSRSGPRKRAAKSKK